MATPHGLPPVLMRCLTMPLDIHHGDVSARTVGCVQGPAVRTGGHAPDSLPDVLDEPRKRLGRRINHADRLGAPQAYVDPSAVG